MSDENILIVDDNPANLAVLQQLLSQAGYRARPADSGAIALASLQRTPADLILLDIRMPNMDGYQVCQALKANPATRDIPVIFLSALNAPEDKIKAFECGGVDYLSKPFNHLEVLARVKTHLHVRKLQQDLQRYNKTLEAEVAQRTASLCQANAGLEKALAAKRDFLSLMSHEFRTPLNGILGMTGIMKPDLDELQRDYLEVIENSGWRLLKLVEDILQVAQQSGDEVAKEAPRETLDVAQLCRDTLQSVAALAEQKQITANLQAENLPLLVMPLPPPRLRQILGNLLDNAVKFTPAGGQFGIRAAYLTKGQELSLEVWDTGPGIPTAERRRIFEPFVQLEPILSRHHEGPGLGLTLARNLAELHGGTITVWDRPGGGSVFKVALPAKTLG